MWDVAGGVAAVVLLGGLLVFNHWRVKRRRPKLRERRDGEPLGQRIEEAGREWKSRR